MKPTPTRRGLEPIVRDILAPFLEPKFSWRGWSLFSWDSEQGICISFRRENSYVLVEFEGRNDRLDCYARTRRFNVCARRLMEESEMSDDDRQLVDHVIATVREREGNLPDHPREASDKPVAVREILVDRLLMPEGKNQYYINPYVGCMLACPFCYVIDRADFSRRLEGLPELPWGRYLDVKVNAAEVLRREIANVGSGVVRMSPILTDPYQPAERRYRITRQILEVLVDSELAPVVLTRAPRILDDLELLERFPRALVGFSIPTDNDRYRQIFEPSSDPIDERLEALRALHAAGIGTFVVIQPVLPMNVDRLVELVAPYVRAVRLDYLHAGERVQPIYDTHGLGKYASEAFGHAAIRRLTAGFQARGVVVDSLDDLEPLLGAA